MYQGLHECNVSHCPGERPCVTLTVLAPGIPLRITGLVYQEGTLHCHAYNNARDS